MSTEADPIRSKPTGAKIALWGYAIAGLAALLLYIEVNKIITLCVGVVYAVGMIVVDRLGQRAGRPTASAASAAVALVVGIVGLRLLLGVFADVIAG